MSWRRFQTLTFGLSSLSYFRGVCDEAARKQREKDSIITDTATRNRMFANWGSS